MQEKVLKMLKIDKKDSSMTSSSESESDSGHQDNNAVKKMRK